MSDRLNPGESLAVNASITSQSGRFMLIMQGDGNLVLYRIGIRPLWASNTDGRPAMDAIMQGDGNFVVYDNAGHPLWASGTDGHPGAWLIVQNDGNLVIYDTAGNALWASNTSGVIVGVEWTNNFSSPCTQVQLSNCNGGSEGFAQAMANRGHYWVFDWGDGNAWETDWRDTGADGDAFNTQGGSESVDFAYLSTHGGSNGNSFVAAFGTQHDNCLWNNNTAFLGAGELKWVVFDTCESLQLPTPWNEWAGSVDGIHLIFGFTDNASDTSGRGHGFGSDAGKGKILSSSWLNNAYSWWYGDHPVVLAPGRDLSDAQNRLFNETIYSGFDSIPSSEITYYWAEWES